MMKINAVSMVREIRDKQFEEIKDLKGDALKKYYAEKAKWTLEPSKIRPIVKS
jgi:hypothetical protein